MKHNRRIGKVLVNELSKNTDFILLYYAQWSPAPVVGLKMLSELLSKQEYINIDLVVIDIDDEFYNFVKIQFNLRMSHGWGEIHFLKDNTCVSPVIRALEIKSEDLAAKLNAIYR